MGHGNVSHVLNTVWCLPALTPKCICISDVSSIWTFSLAILNSTCQDHFSLKVKSPVSDSEVQLPFPFIPFLSSSVGPPRQHSVPQLHEYLLGQSVFDLKMTTVISRVVVLYYNAFLKQKTSSSFAKDVLPKTMHINFHHVIMIYLSWTISYKCMVTRKLFSDVVMCSDIPALHLCLIISHIRGGIAAHC